MANIVFACAWYKYLHVSLVVCIIIGKMIFKVTPFSFHLLNLSLCCNRWFLSIWNHTWLAVGCATGPEPFLANFFLCTLTPPLTTTAFVNLKEHTLTPLGFCDFSIAKGSKILKSPTVKYVNEILYCWLKKKPLAWLLFLGKKR